MEVNYNESEENRKFTENFENEAKVLNDVQGANTVHIDQMAEMHEKLGTKLQTVS